MIEINKIKSPFIYYCQKVIPLAFDESLSYYEVLCHLTAKIKEVIDEQNTEGEAIQELQQKYLLLVDYVDHYFDNLDVQEEINNKLDEMYENGQLQSLIEQYIQLVTLFTFSNIDEMCGATNIVNGSYCKTLGFYEINDLGGAYYKIRTVTNEDVIDNIHLFAIENDNTLVAELLASEKINVKQLGALNSIDNTNIIQYALNNYTNIIIEDLYEVTDTLAIENDNTLISGNGGLYINHSETKNLMEINNKNNITIKGISLHNDNVARTGSTEPSPLYLLKVNGINNLLLDNVNIYNAYHHAIEIKSSNNIKVINSTFKNCYYDMLMILTEVDNVLVDNCIFNTITGTYSNTYLFATGSNDYVTQVDYMAKNVTVQNSKFLNNPNWEGIDSHGCKGFKVLNNYIYNCKEGIHYLYDKRTPVTEYANSDIIIMNNIVENPEILNTTKNGVVVSGADINFVDNVVIENNVVKDFGGANSTYPVNVEYGKNFIIKNNQITGMNVAGIQTAWTYNGIINDNIIKYPYNESSYGIRINAYSWFIRCDNNYILGGNNSFQYGILVANYKGLAIFGHNFINGYKTARLESYNNSNTIIGEVTNSNTRRLGIKGVYSVDINDIPKSYCTDDVVRSISESVTGITITANVNDTIITLPNSEDVISKLCIGQEIVISGAGSGGANLTTTIVDIIGINKFIIKDPILSSVSNVHPSTTASSWSNF